MATRNNREGGPDVAVRLLRDRRTPMHYKDLIIAILEEKGESTDITPLMMSQMLTQINLDARFVHMGSGMWGLRDWNPTVSKPAEKTRTVRAKISEDLLEDLEDDLVEEDDEELVIDEEEEIVDDEGFDEDIEEIEELDEDEEEEEQP